MAIRRRFRNKLCLLSVVGVVVWLSLTQRPTTTASEQPVRLKAQYDSIVQPEDAASSTILVTDEAERWTAIKDQHDVFFDGVGFVRRRKSLQLGDKERRAAIRRYFYRKLLFYQSRIPEAELDRPKPWLQSTFKRRLTVKSSMLTPIERDDPSVLCLKEGANIRVSKHLHACACRKGWSGPSCTIAPGMNSSATKPVLGALLPAPRRIVYTLVVHFEVEHLITILESLWSVVDVFVIGEMDTTHYGDPRPPFIRLLMEAGAFAKYESKLLYTLCTTPHPKRCLIPSTFECENAKFDCLQTALHERVIGLHPDDLIVYTDTDEHIPREVLLSLKLHASTFEHFSLSMLVFLYSCAWMAPQPIEIRFAATWRLVVEHSLLAVRGRRGHPHPVAKATEELLGFHCSWCADDEGIIVKLISAVNADPPRWGSYKAFVTRDYVEFLISHGVYFNLKMVFDPVRWTDVPEGRFKHSPHCFRYIRYLQLPT